MLINESMSEKIIEEAFEKYSFSNLAIAFNGGKESLLVLSLLKRHAKIPYAFYLSEKDPFPELVSYRKKISQQHNFTLHAHNTLDDLPSNIEAIFMGTRQTDPDGVDLKHFQMTDPGWVQFMRINPILNWNYHQVWKALLEECFPICILYYQGYTSIGERYNTKPNPKLKNKNSYLEAWYLEDEIDERMGRY
jgi:FAD synthetase